MEVEKKNYYEVLEIEPIATPAQIEQAYVRARNAYTGDSVALYSLMTKNECDEILGQIEEAYAVLGFPEKRREYDRIRGFNKSQGLQQKFVATQPAFEENSHNSIQYEDFGSNLIEARVSKVTALQKFSLEYKKDQEMERIIEDCGDFTGAFLRKVREYKNVSIDRMAEMTKISKLLLNAIENEELNKLPADVYVRGYVYQYAKVLKLNPDKVATSFLLHFKKLKSAR